VPVIAAEIEELRWVAREDADELEVAPLARENFLP
jgi:8-oxo-dGTP diphosphatase